MSVHIIYYKDGAKLMRPVKDETEYRLLRDAERNRTADKHHMVQMNYSCLPNENGALKGATRLSRSVGMDIVLTLRHPTMRRRWRRCLSWSWARRRSWGCSCSNALPTRASTLCSDADRGSRRRKTSSGPRGCLGWNMTREQRTLRACSSRRRQTVCSISTRSCSTTGRQR